MWIDLRMVAPSLVTVILFLAIGSPTLYKILSIPLGPKVVLTRSAMAIAPTNDCYIIIMLIHIQIGKVGTYHSCVLSFIVSSLIVENVGQYVLWRELDNELL